MMSVNVASCISNVPHYLLQSLRIHEMISYSCADKRQLHFILLRRIAPLFSVNIYLTLYLKTTKLPVQPRLHMIGTSEGLKKYKYTKIEIQVAQQR